MGMFRYYDLGVSEVFIFDEFFINQIREGVVITPEHNTALRAVIDEHFSNKPVIYISNRFFSYTVNPLTYLETSKIHNLVGIAIIAEEPAKRTVAQYESGFFNKPYKIFKTLGEAIEWVHKTIPKSKNHN